MAAGARRCHGTNAILKRLLPEPMLLRRWGENDRDARIDGVAAAQTVADDYLRRFPPEPTPAQRGRFAEGRERDRLEASMGCGLALVATLAAPAGWGATVILVRPANPKAVTAERWCACTASWCQRV